MIYMASEPHVDSALSVSGGDSPPGTPEHQPVMAVYQRKLLPLLPLKMYSVVWPGYSLPRYNINIQ